MQPASISAGSKRTKGYKLESLLSDEDSADEPEDMALGPRGPPPKRVKRGLREYRSAFEARREAFVIEETRWLTRYVSDWSARSSKAAVASLANLLVNTLADESLPVESSRSTM